MSALDRFIDYFKQKSTVAQTLSSMHGMSIDAAITESNRWKPIMTWASYDEEVRTRIRYLNKDMQEDMLNVLRRRFPQTHKDIEQEQVNIGLVKKMIADKAKIFMSPGKFEIVDMATKKPIGGDTQKILDDLINEGEIISALQDIDRKTRATHRIVAKAWWDPRWRCVRVSSWSMDMVPIVPNPDLYWSIDDAKCVLFQLPSIEGMTSSDLRYEVWSKMRAEDGTWLSSHYRTQTKSLLWTKYWQDGKINPENQIPFVDEETGEPIYPFVLFKSDSELGLYHMPDQDFLTINRMMNSSLTDICNGFHFNLHPAVSFKVDEGISVSPPANTVIGPGHIMNQAGIHAVFTSPNFDPSRALEFWKVLVELEKNIEGGDVSAIFGEGSNLSSGVSLKIKRIPIEEDRKAIIPIYKPTVEDLIRRCILVWNIYADGTKRKKIDMAGKFILWTPGDLIVPVDEEAQSRTDAADIQSNLKSIVEVRMARTGEDEATAEDAIRENKEINDEFAKPKSTFGIDPNNFKIKDKKEEPEEEETTPPQDDEEMDVEE